MIIYRGILCFLLPYLVNCSLNHDLTEIRDSVRPKPLKGPHNLKTSGDSGYRLPTNLKPTDYYLTIYPYLPTGIFEGGVSIVFDVVNRTNEIVLNVRFDSIRNDSLLPLKLQSNPPVSVSSRVIDQEHQMVRYQLNDTLQEQKGAVIAIYYNGTLATDMMGFYLSTYNTTDQHGQPTEHLMAITQFEGTYARRAFPCFDEPEYRASFNIKIMRDCNQTSMSNMNLTKTEIYSKFCMDTYESSPSMPTYLVAFGVSDFAWQSDGGNVRVATRPDIQQDATFALSIAQRLLDSIGNFTNVHYPLKKMDIVAVPDFSAGAMENWGLTTYREKYVIYNPIKNTNKDKFGVVSVIAHEFGHQWFGDLVTPQWWDYTWLNEAFATYFEYIIPNQLYPEWNLGSAMYIQALQSALASDVGDPRPMTSPVYTPDQIEAIFDYVIYEKGGSVLRMIENFLTTPVWRDGLYRYLTSNAYKTGTPKELFDALEAAAKAANSPISDRVVATFNSWTTQPGYPLVKIHKEPGQVYLVTQSPYEMNNTDIRWSIPLTYTWQEEAQFDASKAAQTLLYTTGDTLYINTTGWVIFNIDQIGYFRVNYEDDNWNKIINQLKSNHSVIGPINRAQLLDDAFHLSKTGHLNYSIYMGLTDYLHKETSYAPWDTFFTNTQFLINQFYNTSTGDGLMKYARGIMTSPLKALMSSLESSPLSFLDSLTLPAALQFACDMRLPACESLASSAFQNWTQDPYSIAPETRQAVICTQLRMDSSGKSFQAVLDYFLNSDNGAEKLSFMRAMGCVSNQAAINTYLNVICDASANHIRSQDRYIAYKALVSHQPGVDPGLQYLTSNYDKVSQALGSRLDSVFTTLGNTISQDAHISQVIRLINDTGVDQRLRYKLETLVLPPVLKRQAWTQSPQAKDLKNWIHDNDSPSSSSLMSHSLYILLFSVFFIFSF